MKLRNSLLIVLCGGAGAFLLVHAIRARGDKATRYVTRLVDRGDVVQEVTATGTVTPVVQVDVGTQVSGTISELRCDFNSIVQKGQVLARIDPSLFKTAREQAAANLAAARANLLKAQANAQNTKRIYQRDVELAKQQLVAPQDVDAAKAAADSAVADVEAARAAIQQAEATLDNAQVNLDHTIIYAPVSGTVIARDVQVGQTVAASLASPTLFTIAQDLSQMEVDANIAEADVGHLHAGQPVKFTVDAYPGQPFEADLSQVRNDPTTVQNVVTYVAVIHVKNPRVAPGSSEYKLRPGMTANVQVIVGQAQHVLRVPNAALRFVPPSPAGKQGGWSGYGGGAPAAGPGGSAGGSEAGMRAVYVLQNGAPVRHLVRTGLTDGAFTQIVAGDLAAGEAVITDVANPQAGPMHHPMHF